MHVKRRQLNKAVVLCLAFVFLAVLMCGCGLMPTPANTDSQLTPESTQRADEPGPTQNADEPGPAPNQAALAQEQRLSEAKDCFLWDNGYLRAIDDKGNVRKNAYIGVLYFGKDGYYTSGSKELDELVAIVVSEYTNSGMTRMEMLRAMYDYTVGNLRYVGQANYNCSYLPAHGKDGWMPELAIKALNNGYGNCYSYAAVFAALARGVGYQAYAVGGQVGATEDPHGWVQILDEDGNVWMNDPEIEFRFGSYYKSVGSKDTAPDLFYKSPDMIGAETGLSYRALRNPYEAEAKEAEYRHGGIPPVSPKPTESVSPAAANNLDDPVGIPWNIENTEAAATEEDKQDTTDESGEENGVPGTDGNAATDNADQTAAK